VLGGSRIAELAPFLGDHLTTILDTDPAPGVAIMRVMQMRYRNSVCTIPFSDLVFEGETFEGETSIGAISGGIYLRLGLSRSFVYFSRETV
jgi:hypothetical protein